jgi:hypothetical protein
MTSVAGDFYDFIVVDEKHIGILVADVSGHGMPAALIASMLKIALSTPEAHASDPAQVLLGLNKALCGIFQHHFVTAAYLFVDMQKRTLTYAGAGHPPLLLWGGSFKGVRAVMENGMFLGRFRLQRILLWSCRSGLVIELCFTLMESPKRPTQPELSLVPTASDSFWRRSKVPRQVPLPIDCLKSCPAGRLEARPTTWMTILRWLPSR